MWDVGNTGRVRELWDYYFQHVDLLIYVVDSNDRQALPEAIEGLNEILQNEQAKGDFLKQFFDAC